MWSKESLHDLVNAKLGDYLFVVVSNREPYIHTRVGSEIQCHMPASGLTVALDPIMQACSGTWVAHGSGNADKEVVDNQDKTMVPPDNPRYSLKRVWLSKEEEDGYYYGFSNDALWPLCHIAYTRPRFEEADWNSYKKVNELFAQAILEEVQDRKAFIFIQDYHLSLLSRLLKKSSSNVITAQFWHIPWPNSEVLRVCPWHEEILHGLLGNDMLGFHIRYHCNNFMDSVNRLIESKVDWEKYEITRGGRKTAIRHFPISVDFQAISDEAAQTEVETEIARLKKRLGLRDEYIGMGLDRADYTKGIPDRFRAIDRFLEKNPEYQGRLVFIQAGVPSRTHIEAYKRLNDEMEDLVEDINWKYASGSWMPIIHLKEHLPPITLLALRRMADFCVVSSLHDGMNLVAKEYVASRYDEDGVLILSPFTGSARELTGSLLVNPYATDHFAESIKQAIEMSREAKRQRMRRMREVVRENNIYKWASDIVSAMVKFEFGET